MNNYQEDIQVSVCVVTYNQDKYIAECLDSLVSQKTNFKFEIIVGEDCSTDGTRAIVQQYVDKYPDIVKPVFHKSNVGAVENVKQVYKKAEGKYIAHMDGDDYALSNKLQIQVDILNENINCTICTHDMELTDSDNNKYNKGFSKFRKNINTLEDLYQNLPFFAHSSKMFLNNISENFWSNFNDETIDIELHVKQAKNGNIYHINSKLGGYRQYTGVAFKKNKINPLLPNATRRIFEEAINNGIYDKNLIKKSYAKAIFGYAYQSALLKDKEGLVNFISESISICSFSKKQLFFYRMRAIPTLIISLCKLRAYLS